MIAIGDSTGVVRVFSVKHLDATRPTKDPWAAAESLPMKFALKVGPASEQAHQAQAAILALP